MGFGGVVMCGEGGGVLGGVVTSKAGCYVISIQGIFVVLILYCWSMQPEVEKGVEHGSTGHFF